MKHLTYSEKSLLVGDEVADVLMEFAAKLADRGAADTVRLNAIGVEGNDVSATLLLDSGTVLITETATTSVKEPDNSAAVAYMRERMDLMESPITGQPFDDNQMTEFDRSMFEE